MKNKRALSWLIALGLTAMLMTFVLLGTEVRYSQNDDAGILRAFLGQESGTPARFHIYIHGLFALPLAALSTAFPLMPWFTYLQLALLALACVVISKSIMQCFVKHDQSIWLGAAAAALFLLTLCLKHISRITFTETAALLGAAAVLQMLSVDYQRGGWRVTLGLTGAAVLVMFAYALRQVTALPVLAFCGLVFAFSLWHHRAAAKPMLAGLFITAFLMGGMAGFRAAETENSGAQDYLAWQDANTQVIDFYGLDKLGEEELALVGWDETTLRMAKSWCFLDSDLSTEAFLTLTDHLQKHDTRTFADRASQAWTAFANMVKLYQLDMRCLCLALIAGVFALVCACIRKNLRTILLIACAVLGAAAMLAYLSWEGRLPIRAVMMVTMPLSAVLMAMLPSARKGVVIAGLCVMTALCAWCLTDILPVILPNEEEELALGNAMGDLEEYAVDEPDSLFIYDSTLVGADLRAFPDYEYGMPTNLTFWGGWGLRSPENCALFERWGIDLADFDPETFLRDDVFLATGRIDPPPTMLLKWLEAKTGKSIDWEIWSEYGSVYIPHFYEY